MAVNNWNCPTGRVPVELLCEQRHFLIGEDKNLVGLEEQPYDAEDLLKTLLATHPDLLAGDQIDRASPRKWPLIVVLSREDSDPWFAAHQDPGQA
jgi:hypothetical protein